MARAEHPHGWLIVLGAGESQIPVIREARALGLAVAGVDRNPLAAGFRHCDFQIAASTHDIDAVLAGLKPLEGTMPFVGVVTRSHGRPTVTRAQLAAHYGLPGPGVEASLIASSKRRMIAFARERGLAVPAPVERGGAISFPVVIKPDHTTAGKKDVRLARTPAEFADAVARAGGNPETVELEPYVGGSDVLAIATVHGGVVQPWLLLDEHVALTDQGEFFGVGFTLPAQTAGAGAAWPATKNLVRELGITDGVVIAAFRVTPAGVPVLIEVHLDLGGDLVMDALVPAMGIRRPFRDVLLPPFVGAIASSPALAGGVATLLYWSGPGAKGAVAAIDPGQWNGVVDWAAPRGDGRRGHVVIRSEDVTAHARNVAAVQAKLRTLELPICSLTGVRP